jgi:hypothetical protein
MDAVSDNARRRPRSVPGSIAVAIAVLGAGAATPLAWSQEPPPPPEGPAISQYVETLPSGSGGQAVGVGRSRTKPLPTRAAKKLAQKKTPLAPKLKSIATSSSYGAPQQTLPRRSTAPTLPRRSTTLTPAKPIKAPQRHARAAQKRHARVAPDRRNHRPAATARSTEPDRTALSAAVSAATGGGDRGPVILLGAIVLFTTAAGIAAAARRARQGR